MFTFNTQCSLSHQTIKEGDPCVLMMLKPSKGQTAQGFIGEELFVGIGNVLNISEPDSYWSLQSMLMHVEYEGAGYFNLVDKGNTIINAYNLMLDYFNNDCILEPFADGDDEPMVFNFQQMLENNCPQIYMEFAVKDKLDISREDLLSELNTAFSYLQTFSRMGRLFVPVDDIRGLLSVQVSPMHLSAYEYLLKKVEDFKREDGFYNDIDGKVDSLLEDIERSVAMKTEDIVLAVNHLHTSMPAAETKAFNMLTKHLVRNKLVLDKTHARNLFGRYFEMSSLLEAMETMNLKLVPQIYSKDGNNNDSGNDFLEFTQHVNQSVVQSRKNKP